MAQKFRFRLETLLKIHSLEAATLQGELENIRQQKRYLEQQLTRYQQQIATLKDRYRHHTIYSIQQLETQWHYLRRLQQDMSALEAHYRQLLSEEHRCRARLTAALQKQRSLEKLKERHQAAYRQEQQRAEQKQLDDISQQRHNRRQQE